MGLLVVQGLEQWRSLVQEAQYQSQLQLHEDLESYLVFLLNRYNTETSLAESRPGFELLQSLSRLSSTRSIQLRDVGDRCLLFAGFFPGIAQRRRVNVRYFVDIGQSAYGQLSMISKDHLVGLYRMLSKQFIDLMKILHEIRALAKSDSSFSSLQAIELWSEFNSTAALSTLPQHTQSSLVRGLFGHC
jgi:hypothetical protein